MRVPRKIGRLLKHTSAEVRVQALGDLSKEVREPSVIIPLAVKQLEDSDWRVRKTAIGILLDIRGRAVTDALIGALHRDDSPNARNAAVEALVSLGPEATGQLIESYEQVSVGVKKFVIDIIGSAGDPKAIPMLLKVLEDEDRNIRASAVEHLGNIRGNITIIDALIRVLRSGDVWLSYPAAGALGKIADARATDALISVLPQKALRVPAIKALGEIADVRALSSIVPYLKDRSVKVREETIVAIGRYLLHGASEEKIINDLKGALGRRARSMIRRHVESSRRELKVTALLLLGLLKDRQVIPRLLEVSVDEDFQEAIMSVLVFMGKSMPRALIPYLKVEDIYQKRVISDVAGRVGSAVFFRPLISCLRDEDGHVRGRAALALSRLDDPKAVAHIKPLLLDEYQNIQEEAIVALSRLQKWLDVDEIISGLHDDNVTMRKNSAILLGLLGQKKSVDALGTALKDSDLGVRVAVIKALGDVDGSEVLDYLIQAVTDESSEARLLGAIAIGKIRAGEGLEPLTVLLRDPDVRVRAAAAAGLGRLGDGRAIEPLLRLLSDESGFVRTSVIEAIRNFRDSRVRKALLRLLKDEDAEIRTAAVESLAEFDGVAQDIIRLLKDNEWSVRKKAVDVLGEHFKDESYAYLKEIASNDQDFHVRETAARHLGV